MAKTDETANAELLTGGFPDLATLLAAGRDTSVSEPVENDDGSVTYFLGEGVRAHNQVSLNPKLPAQVAQAEVFVEPKSFADYITMFKSSTAICRASLGSRKIDAVLDYHGQARSGDAEHATPGRCKHVVTLNCPFDVDYAKWRAVLGKFITQEAMINFIEDLIHTIAEPAAAVLTEAISDVEIERMVKFKSKRNDKNGNLTVGYEEKDGESTRSGEFSLPDHVIIVVPIFQGGNPQQLTAKLRVRMEKGEFGIGLSVPGLENIEREAFRSIGESVRKDTDTPVFYAA